MTVLLGGDVEAGYRNVAVTLEYESVCVCVYVSIIREDVLNLKSGNQMGGIEERRWGEKSMNTVVVYEILKTTKK